MAEQVLKMRIQLRRATTAEWEANKSVVPAAGEPCFDLELNTLKIGDGVKTYEQLKSIGSAEVAADGTSIVLTDGVFKLAGFDAAETGAQPRKKADGTIEWIVPSTETVEGLQTTVAALQSDVKTLQDIVTPTDEGTVPLLDRVTAIEKAMTGTGAGSVDEKINTAFDDFMAKVSEDGTVNTVKELIDYVADHEPEAARMAADITALQTAVAGKVDAEEGKSLVSDTLIAKLESIEEGAQANKIEAVKVGNTLLDIVGKTVTIPVAGLNNAGVVKSSTGANKVNISKNGVMSVNKISTNSIFVPIGDELVLDGGGASRGAPVYPTRIGNVGYDSIADAVNCADNGDIITLQEDVNMGSGDNDNLVINSENVTIDLGGKTLTANGSNGAVRVNGGVTTLDGAGTVSGTLGSDNYSMAVWASNGTVVINDGTYINMTDGSTRGTDLIYASGTGRIEINGGIFEAAKPEWTLNCKDVDYKAGTAKIIVKGGSFKGFDPANNNAEGAGTNFVADGYKSVLEGEYYVVKPI